MGVHLEPASATERETVRQLLELNAYEFSRLDGRAVRDDGTFGYPYLDAYWSEATRYPYLIRADEELAGLVLVSAIGHVSSVSEFLVLPKFRRRRVGETAARTVFARHRGPWVVTQTPGNVAATSFWRRVIPVTFEESVSSDGVVTQTFNCS